MKKTRKKAVKPKKTGRPKKEIDARQVVKLARINCSYAEMAAVLDCSASTLKRRFGPAIKRGRELGTSSLKRKQYIVAMRGHVGMLIWLGKNMLGQTDRQVLTVAGDLPTLTIKRASG